jgi:hypothetical protein
MSTTTTTSVPAPTPEERALTAKQVELAEFQLQELRKQSAAQEDFATQIGPLLEAQAAEAERQSARAKELEPVQDEILQIQLADLRRGGAASPEQQALIDKAADEALAAGSVDIERFRTESLDALRNELAPGRGLRPSDSPVLDRGARVAAEATRQGGQLASTLRSAAASGKVNLGLAGSQLTQASSLGLAQVTEATRQFQQSLSQQAFANRLTASGQSAGIGLGLAGNPAATLSSAINPLTQARLGSSSTSSGGLGQFIGPAIGAGGAVGSSALILSSKDYKTDKTPIDEDEVLKRLARLPVERWRYKDGLGLASEPEHVGPYAEDFEREFGLGDGKAIPVVDGVGLGLAAASALAKKVERIERGLGLAKAA